MLSNASGACTCPTFAFRDVRLLRQGLTDVLYLGMRLKLCPCRFRSLDDFGVSLQAVSGLCLSCS